jgi:hypothetical protein
MIRSNPTPPPPDAERLINQALVQSVQIPPQTTKEGTVNGFFGIGAERGSILPPRGTRQRELQLKAMYFWDEMNLIRGAFTNIAKIIASVGWEITGDEDEDDKPAVSALARMQGWRLRRNTGVEYFQEVFRQSNFGAGWGALITQVILDFLRYDAGAYIEVIGQGEGFKPLLGPVMGLAHLDPLHCYPTGDPIYPCVYYDRYGGMHIMHHTRVIRLVDMDDGDDRRPGYGDSALSRSASIAMQELWMSRYITGRLDDQSPPGFDIMGGITKKEMEAAEIRYRAEQGTDTRPIWGRRLRYYTPDPSILPKIESYDFQASPENFDWEKYTNIEVDRLANAIGVDRQEIMQLMGGNIGSGQQSVVLNQKSKGKTIGFVFQQLERKLNDLLPVEFTFEFKARDTQESLEDAQIGQTWAAAVASMGAALSPQEQRTLLADNVEAVRDAIANTKEAGDVFQQATIAEDDTPGSAPVAPQAADGQAPNTPQVNVNDDVVDEIGAKAITQKDYATTQAMFVQDVADLLRSAVTPNPYLDRRAFGVTMRSFLKNYGLKAYKDGLSQGGVNVDTLDPDDNAAYMRVFMEQSQYITGLAEDVFVKKAVTPANAQSRAMMWGKSLEAFDMAGLVSADRNGMRIWRRNLLKDSCVDCIRLEGQVHRVKTWYAHKWLPRSSRLKCFGAYCGCSLEKTTERARGRF